MAFAGGGAARPSSLPRLAAVAAPPLALATCSGLRQTCRSGVITSMMTFLAA